MSEGSQGQKGNQITSESLESTEQHTGATTPPSDNWNGGDSKSGIDDRSGSTSAVLLGSQVEPDGDQSPTASVNTRQTQGKSTSAHKPSVLQYTRQLVTSITEHNFEATVEEIDILAANSGIFTPVGAGAASVGSLRLFVLRLLLLRKDESERPDLTGAKKSFLVDQILKSNFTDLYLLIEYCLGPRKDLVGAERSESSLYSFPSLLEQFFPVEFCFARRTSGLELELGVGCICGLALATAVLWCSGSRDSDGEFTKSTLEFLVEGLEYWNGSSGCTQASPEEDFWIDTASSVLATFSPFSALGRKRMSSNNKSKTNGEGISSAAENLARDLSTPGDLVRVLKELGPGCTASVATFRDALRETSRGTELNEKALSHLICFFAEDAICGGAKVTDHYSAAQDEEISSFTVGTFIPNSTSDAEEGEANSEKTGDSAHASHHPSSNSSAKNGWDLDVVRTCIAEDYCTPKRDWDAVARFFDFPVFFIGSQSQLKVLLDLYSAGAHRQPPSRILLSDWQNARGQLSLLSQLAVAPVGIYTFDVSDEERSDMLTKTTGSKSPNTAWVCGDFLERLLKLSDQAALNTPVREVFIQGLLQCPQVLLCSLVRLQLRLAGEASKGNNAAGQAGMQMKNELMRELVPYFFNPNTHHQGQASVISEGIKHLWTISPNTVTLACIESWRSTASLPPNERIATASHIVAIIRLLGPESTKTILNNTEDIEFSLAIAMVAADREIIQLTTWVHERINALGMVFLIQFIAFAGKLYPTSVPRVSSENEQGLLSQASPASLLSMENLVTSLKILQGLDPNLQNQPIPNVPGVPSGDLNSNRSIGESIKALTEACLSKHPSLRSLTNSGDSSGASNDDIEEMANSYFQKIYTSENGITEVVEMLKKFKISGNQRENDIFACMIHNLFDEYRFFSKYPEKELRITGILFGMLIREQLVSSITLGIALRYVLEALRKPPGDGTNSNSGKMFRFGMFALEQFKERLHEWPQYCSHIVQIPHLKQGYADLVAEIDEVMEESQATKASGQRGVGNVGVGSGVAPSSGSEGDGSPRQEEVRVRTSSLPGSVPSSPRSNLSEGEVLPGNKSRSVSVDEQMQILPNGLLGSSDVASGLNLTTGNSSLELMPQSLVLHNAQHDESTADARKVAVFGPGLGRAVTDTDREPQHEAPSDAIVDRVQFIINNMSPSNVESKAQELKDLLPPEHFGWLGNYLVVKRISTQPNFHSLYLSFLDQLGDYGTGLVEAILASVYVNVGKLLRSPKITTSTSERSLLKNLGSWLGQITLARNRPILQITLDCKELLYQGYETGMLIAVTPFVAKILEGAKNSFVFRPPNPWLMGLLGVFRALYDVEDLKMNIKFEVEVLCKNLGLKVEEIPPRSDDLMRRIPPVKGRNPDFNVKSTSSGVATPGASASAGTGGGGGAGPSLLSSPGRKEAASLAMAAATAVPGIGSLMSSVGSGDSQSQFGTSSNATGEAGSAATSFQGEQQQTVIPNLAAYVTINPSLAQLFQQLHSGSAISAAVLKRTVPVAVDRAIREIIQPVVERSVTIACITTKEIVTKDFAMESDENKMRKAAQLMVANLAGSLALVTCREPLRASVSTHLRQLLLANASGSNAAGSASGSPISEQEQAAVEQCVTICATDNLDLGCKLIEKAATEKAVRDMDEALAPALQARRKHREQTGQPFYDMSIFGSGNHRYPAALPEPLRPKPGGGLRAEQLLVYEAFQRIPGQSAVQGTSPQVVNVGTNLVAPNAVRSGSLPVAGNGRIADGPSLSGGNVLATSVNSIAHQQLGLEALSSLATKLNNAVTTLLTAAGPRAVEITLAMLPPDHEIRQLLLVLKRATLSAQASRPLSGAETEAVLGFGQSVFKRLYELSLSEPLRLETLVALLEGLNECCPQLGQDMGTWATYAPTETDAQRKLHLTILLLLVRSRLIPVGEIDEFLAKNIDGGRSVVWLDFALLFVRTAVLERIAMSSDMPKVMDILTKVGEGRGLGPQQSSACIKPINRFLEEVRTASGLGGVNNVVGIAPSTEQQVPLSTNVATDGGTGVKSSEKESNQVSRQQGSSIHASLASLAEASKRAADATSLTARNDPPGMRQQVTFLLDSWIRVQNEAQGNDKMLAQYLQLLQQHGVGKVDEQTERFFRHSTELVVEAVLKSGQAGGNNEPGNKQQAAVHGTVLNYAIADAYSKLIVLLVRYMNAGGNPEQIASQRISLLNKILGITMRTLMSSYERSKQSTSVGAHWDQRPWFRILLNMVHDLNAPSPVFDPISIGILTMFGSAFHVVQPLVVPGFAFAWLELMSHRMFLSNLLLAKDQKGWDIAHQLLIDLFLFLEPHLRKTELTEAIKHLYKGTLRVLLVLLHDFPSFLAGYHLSLCNVIPDNCVQLRNLILSAFPRGMVLPDPFTPNLKIDLLPEISNSPVLLSNVTGPLGPIRTDLDSFLKTRHPTNFASDLLPRLYKNGSGDVDVPRVNSLVLYVGIQAIARLQNSQIAHTPEMEVIHKLMDFDDHGRYISLNAIANQLRFPSSHTHYFSCVMLFLFSEAKDEGVKEQITRVLLERLIVHRPHPWGLLITFIELIKNQRYQFWSHPFTRCATEIEKVFESVARSCMTPASRTAATAGGESSQ